MRTFFRQLRPAVVILILSTLLLGVVYPLTVTAFAQGAFGHRANGSIIRRGGTAVGSSLIGQPFTSPQYFHPRPSAAGSGYDGSASSGSNLGPNNETFLTSVRERVDAYRSENGLSAEVAVPVDAVTASGSGLDPQITLANARLQARRVAEARGLTVAQVLRAIDQARDRRPLLVLGDEGVNVLRLNLALDDLKG